jgi:uncharacterized protein DUF6895
MPQVLDQLSAGALDWLERNLDYFDPYSARATSAEHAPAKAALELALLCSCSARLGDAAEGRLEAAVGVVRAIWQHAQFLDLFDEFPEYAASYSLIYAALAPAGCDAALRRTALARLTPEFLSPADKSPYQCLEIRYYADRAGVRHGIAPYPRLIEQSPMVRPLDPVPDAAAPFTLGEAYAVTHSGFYFGDFGRNRTALAGDPLDRARRRVGLMLEHSVRQDQWDLAAELVLTQYILGIEPQRSPQGAAALRRLAEIQRSDGALPGRSPETTAGGSATPARFFAAAYHTTLVTALMALIVSSGRRP